jgi:hypothetical protein
LDERYLELGLSAMATAGEPFMAHFGAALLAGWWFAADQDASPELDLVITATADQIVAKHQWLFAINPSARPDTALEAEIVEHIGGNHLDAVWAIGHDVIYTALAVRTFQARPELCTGPIAEGLHRVIDACHEQPLLQIANIFDVTGTTGAELGLALDEPADVARVALETMVGFTHVYPGLHQGHIGHIIDHAHALISLERVGHPSEARRGRHGFLEHVAALRKIWHESADMPEVILGITDDARQPGYWQHDYSSNDWAVGHVFKYPYALYDLLDLVDDSTLGHASISRVGQLIVDTP